MGGASDSGVGISSTPSLQQSSDLEKTQAELRQTFTAAEKYRRELEFLQKGGDPLDLKPGNAASISFQSTSLADRHPEQFVTSEAKGSFAVTASPHGDSVESSGRLGAPSACEPNSADNLMLFDGENKFQELEKKSVHPRANNVSHITKESSDSAVLELPKKSYKRRIRSRPNRDGGRSSSTDAIPSRGAHFLPFRRVAHDAENQERSYLVNSNSNPKSPNANVSVKSSVNHLENELDGVPPVHESLDANVSQNTQENHHQDQPIKSENRDSVELESLKGVENVHLADSKSPIPEISENMAFKGAVNGFGNTEEIKNRGSDDINGKLVILTKGLDSESTCTQISQRFDGYNGNGPSSSANLGDSTLPMEQNLVLKGVQDVECNDLVVEKDDNILNIEKDKSDISHLNRNEDNTAIKEEEVEKRSESSLQNEIKNSVLEPNSVSQEVNTCSSKPQGSNDAFFQESTDVEQNTVAIKEREDSILEEARIIEAKRKRIAELSVRGLPLEKRLKSQWDFVLEEMSWLANDFAQERLWKLTAAAQIARRVSLTSCVRVQKDSSLQKQKEVAHTLAEAVMQFWHTIQVKCKELDSQCLKKDNTIGIQGYAMRFLEFNNNNNDSFKAQYNTIQAPAVQDTTSDIGVIDNSWEDNLTEENLFYTVPPGAIEAYRKAFESHLLQFEKTGSSIQEEVDTSGYDAVADHAFEEEEGETNTYYLPGVHEGNNKLTKNTQKRRKSFKFHGRTYEMGSGDLPLNQPTERSITIQPSVLSGKRPATSLNVSIPTRRVRTASRQRIISPFNAGTSAPHRTDASSGDTNSFQDEQSSLHGGSQIPNNMEAESVGDYEKQLQFDSMEVSNRPKKKKKARHPGSTFEHRWQLDSNFQNEQMEHSRRRLEPHQFDSNGSSVASQMSNMSNPNKFMKLLVRDRGRKPKSLKTPVPQPGSGSPWSLFEDQALVVLVHDMGPNWELISDAINSTLQFKCIFRKSKECKERHKTLMDRNSGDGADSAEDSGSSQPYPSTLPGIPEGSARQLFQRLQGPMEEDTLKSHFEKIIMIGQKQHYRRTQKEIQDPKQLQQPHSSHAFSLSQVSPNNLNGGPVLTPLELAEAISATPEVVPVGYQGAHSGGLPPQNHNNTASSMLPGSGSSSGPTNSAPGSTNSVQGSNIPAASAPLNPSAREARYGIPRTGSLSADDQQRMQQYNQQLLSARNAQQSSLPPGSHSVTDRGVRMLPAGSGMGVMCGMNRSMKMPRPGYQGIATSASMVGPGNILPPNMHSGAGPSQGNSMLRPRDPMHMIRPNQNTDHQKIATADLQMQQGGIPPFAGAPSPAFPNQMSPPPVQSYPLHHQPQPRPISPHHFQPPPNNPQQHQAYAMRFAKERQLQQRLLQQQRQFSTPPPPDAATTMMPPPPQDSVPSPQMQQSRSSSPPVSIPPMGTQKHHVPPPHGIIMRNQMAKQQQQRQRPHQQFQQPPPPHQQQQQANNKLMKSQSQRGTMMMNPTDSSLSNGFSSGLNPGNKQSVVPNSSSLLSQQKTYSGQLQGGAASSKQIQQQKPSLSSDNNNNNNNQNHASLVMKLANQKQATTPQKTLSIRKVINPKEGITTVSTPCNDTNNSEPQHDNVATEFGKSGSESQHSGPGVDQGRVNRQTSLESMPNN